MYITEFTNSNSSICLQEIFYTLLSVLNCSYKTTRNIVLWELFYIKFCYLKNPPSDLQYKSRQQIQIKIQSQNLKVYRKKKGLCRKNKQPNHNEAY